MKEFALPQTHATVLALDTWETNAKYVCYLQAELGKCSLLYNRIFTVTHLVYYNLCEIIICFLSSAVCSQTCQNEGICSAPNICDCSGTGYMGDQCEIRMLLTSTVWQVFSTDRIFTVTHLVY